MLPRELVITAGDDYFVAVGAGSVAGREFDGRDRLDAPLVAIVNRSFVARYFADGDAIGRRVRVLADDGTGEWRTIVGVAPNIIQGEPTRQRFLPLIYVPFRQLPTANAWVLVRVTGAIEPVYAALRAAARDLDPDLTLESVSTLESSFAFDASRMDLAHVEMGKHAAVAPLFALLALVLAAVGLYAVVTHAVEQRTKEIGLRIAVGARAAQIRRLVFEQELRPVAVGLLVGVVTSLGVNRVLQSQLVGVSVYDPATLLAAGAVLSGVALLACDLPARRAVAVDPAVTLRGE